MNLRTHANLVLLVIALLAPAAAALPPSDPVSPKGVCRVQPFDLTAVRLLDSPFRAALERDRDYLLSLDADRLLHTFRLNAKLPSTAEPYGGWEAPECELRGHFAGHYLSACALMFAATGDARLQQRAAAMVDGLAACQAALGPGGYLSAFPESFIDRVEKRQPVWAPYYTLHKILAGLIDVHARCGNPRALDVARRFGDWLAARNARLTDEQMQAMLGAEHGGINEAMANLYALTADPKHLDAARRFDDRRVLDPLAERKDSLAGLHANTQIPKVTGAARLYELTGEPRYRTIAEFFWETVVNHHSYVIGGNSDREHFDPPGRLTHRLSPWTAETCNTHNMLKLTRHVFAWQPTAAHGEFYERALYNHILATQDPRTGRMGYHVPLHGAWFMPYNSPHDSFWCCTGTGVENHARYGESIYWHDDESLFVNLFIPSELSWKEKNVALKQETAFPESDTTRLTWQCPSPVTLTLNIRQPAWSGPAEVSINGTPAPASAGPSGCLALRREWRNGDRVEVRLPMSLRLEALPDDPARAAICYGPCVLAGALGSDGIAPPMPYAGREQSEFFEGSTSPPAPVLVTNGRPVHEWVEPVPGQPLTFRTKGVGAPADVTLIAFHRLPPQRFSIYWDVLTAAERDKRQAAVVALEQRERESLSQVVDTVRIGDATDEAAHRLEGHGSYATAFSGRYGRRTVRGSFSYELAVPSGAPALLRCSYWGGDDAAEFEIRVENQKIAAQKLNGSRPGEFFQLDYPVPSKLIAGKPRVRVTFRAQPHAAAGALFGLQMLRGTAVPRPQGLNLAPFATPATSFVSGHETLEAIHDGFEPLGMDDHSRDCYGNWPKTGTQWVEYQWHQPIRTAAVDIFWWDDGRGVRLPAACRLLWWDGHRFVPVTGASGLGVAGGSWNTTTFREVTTTRLRLEMDGDGTFSTGIIEWKVYDSGKSPKFAPQVQAGPDRTVVLPASTWLSGHLRGSKDALEWSKLSGPGTVTFADARALETRAGFSQPGDYVLQLIARHGDQSASGSLRARVEPAVAAKPLEPVPVRPWRAGGPFWRERLKQQVVNWIPHCIAKLSEPGLKEGGIENFVEAANKLAGRPHKLHAGAPWANAYTLNTVESMYLALLLDAAGDAELARAQDNIRARLEQWIPIILSAQEPDGYLQTRFTLGTANDNGKAPGHWAVVGDHEGYVAGYFLDAAIAHFRMTAGKDRRLYDAARKLADCWDAHIGPAPRKAWHDGHQGMEMAMVRFGRLVNEVEGTGQGDRYLRLSRFLLDCRGGRNHYDQSHVPVVRQYEALGHAVRASYCYSAMADIARETGDPGYHSAVKSLWDSIVNAKLYLTGGIGAVGKGEAFGAEFELPNNAYSESCANCGMVFLQHRMNLAYQDARYAGLLEDALYNAVLGGVDLPAKNFTYTNPLDQTHARYPWHACPCCVGNIPRTLLSLPTWIYALGEDGVFVNLYAASAVRVRPDLEIVQHTEYPWQPAVELVLNPQAPQTFALRLRVPDREISKLYRADPQADGMEALTVNGQPAQAATENGYAVLTREWKPGDRVRFELPLRVQRVRADERVAALRGLVALRYGPLIYNFEEADQKLDGTLPPDAPLTAQWAPDLLGGVTVIRGTFAGGAPLQAIPNYARNNRGGRSAVWIKEAR